MGTTVTTWVIFGHFYVLPVHKNYRESPFLPACAFMISEASRYSLGTLFHGMVGCPGSEFFFMFHMYFCFAQFLSFGSMK